MPAQAMAIPGDDLDDPPTCATPGTVQTDAVPSFYLYGEPHRAVADGFIHVEPLDVRSRASDWMIRPHAHADLVQLFVIDGGGGVMRVEERTLPVVAPALLLVPAGVVHGFGWMRESAGGVLTVARAYLEALVARQPDLAAVFATAMVLRPEPDALTATRGAMATLARELGWSMRGHHAAVEGALLAVLVAALRALPADAGPGRAAPGQQAALVARFRARVERRFRLREGVAVHAAALGVSESSLRAACATVAGHSPAAILDARAMLESKRALLYSDLSIADVGYKVGFDDPAYFSRFFTRHAGQSPRQFRRGRR